MKFRLTLRRRPTVGLALAGCSLAIVLPAAAGARTESPSQVNGSESAVQNTDLRSPDTRDAARAAAQPSAIIIDLRSPDARDAASAAASGTASTPAAPVAAQPTVVPVVNHGSQTLAIVFSSTALFIALLALGFAAIYRRPRPRWSAS
jgi:hypothetical protein